MKGFLAKISKFKRSLFFLIFLFFQSAVAVEKPVYGEDRSEFVDRLLNHNKNYNPIFATAPITHIVPRFNIITLGLSFNLTNVAVNPTPNPGIINQDLSKNFLKIKGTTFAPLLGVSLKNFGLGITIERGEKTIDYQNSFIAQQSKISYSGPGLYIYWSSIPSISRLIKPTLIFGATSINTKHLVSSYYDPSLGLGVSTEYKYNVIRWTAGTNVIFQIYKNFSLIPWADYQYTDTKSIDSEIESGRNSVGSPASFLYDDLRVVWHGSGKRAQYGIDIAVNLFGLDFRLGNLFGLLANSINITSDQDIEDSSIYFSFSLDKKGR